MNVYKYKFLATLGEGEIEIEDHGILTIGLSADLEDGGTFGSIAGMCFGRSGDWEKQAKEQNALGSFLAGLFEAVGVHSLKELRGKHVYLLTDKEHLWNASDILAIQGLKKAGNKIFDLDEWRKAFKP